jgi:nitrogen fixation protein FixH
MFLYNKKTRNIIKYAWGFFAVLIAFSMIFAYSGFTSLTGTSHTQTQNSTERIELTPEMLEALQNGSSTLQIEGDTVLVASTTHASTTLPQQTEDAPLEFTL